MKLSDIYNSICIDSSVENKNCILLKIVFYFSCRDKSQAAKEFLISKSKREVGFRKRKIARISVDSDIEKGRNSDTEDSLREFDDDAATWNQSTNSYAVLQTSEEIMINHSTLGGSTVHFIPAQKKLKKDKYKRDKRDKRDKKR